MKISSDPSYIGEISGNVAMLIAKDWQAAGKSACQNLITFCVCDKVPATNNFLDDIFFMNSHADKIDLDAISLQVSLDLPKINFTAGLDLSDFINREIKIEAQKYNLNLDHLSFLESRSLGETGSDEIS